MRNPARRKPSNKPLLDSMAPAPERIVSENVGQLLAEALEAQKRNDLVRAQRIYEAILNRQPEMPAALHYLGLVLHRRGQHQKADQLLDKAQNLAPDNAEFLQNHARILARQGRTDAAVPLLERLCVLRPDAPLAIRGLVVALTRLNQWGKASTALEDWLVRHPQEHELWLLAGDLRLHEGTCETACQAWETAGKGSFELRETALLRMANACLQQANVADAQELFEQAVAHNPDSAEAHHGLATAAGQAGDFARLKREAMETVRLDPRCYAAWYQLTLSPDANDEDTADKMRRAIAQTGGDPQAWVLYMALGRILDRCGHYDDAFAAFAEAHRQRIRVFSLNYAQERHYFAAVRDRLGADFVHRRPDAGTENFRPIFIVGMPRSGTTLVEAIVGAHPDVTAGGEMHFLYDWLQRDM
ncbi:MAG: tetratricopeptide repeat-containing sulfotransferase family protein, partial [Gammaproteobacteria bacterium]